MPKPTGDRRMRRGPGVVGPAVIGALALSLLLSQARCIWGSDEDYLASGALDPVEVVASNPADGETDVGRTARLALTMSDRVRPQSVGADGLLLFEGGSEVAAATHVDLLRCDVSVVAASPLAADLEHTLQAEGLEGFESGALRDVISISFVTGQDASPIVPPPPPSFGEVYTAVILPRCASCHSSYQPPGGLDFSTLEAAEEGLLTGRSQYADGAPRFVVEGHHAASYLMHKVLGLPGVWGDPMPLAGQWPEDRTCGSVDPELRLLADWIDGL